MRALAQGKWNKRPVIPRYRDWRTRLSIKPPNSTDFFIVFVIVDQYGDPLLIDVAPQLTRHTGIQTVRITSIH